MKNLLLIFCLCFCVASLKAQVNLVPNPSFEMYDTCPTMINTGTPDQVAYATGWHSSLGSPDYFNACVPSGPEISVPSNFVGNQNAYNGNAYCGFITYMTSVFYREIISSQLTSSLTIGQKYYVTLYINYSGVFSYRCCPQDKIGVLFSTVGYTIVSPPPINNFAHIYTNALISDTLNWVKISGSFIADSSYQYINVGSFFDNAHTDTINLEPNSYNYYYVDAICVSTDSLTCNNTEGISDISLSDETVVVYPNPSSGKIFIESNAFVGRKVGIKMYNVLGQIVETNKTVGNNNKIEFDISNLPEGIYFLAYMIDNKKYSKKIIKQ
jgi:Secretion system C-terminal sorting domain